MDKSPVGSYLRQIVIYLNNGDFESAYTLAKTFVSEYPQENLSHFLLSKSAFKLLKYEEAALEARKAFNLSNSFDDMLNCTIHACTAYFQLREYQKGHQMLLEVEKLGTSPELEELLFIFGCALKDEAEARRHLDHLMKINKNAAEQFMKQFL